MFVCLFVCLFNEVCFIDFTLLFHISDCLFWSIDTRQICVQSIYMFINSNHTFEFSVLCFCVLFVFVMCNVSCAQCCPLSLDCQFLIDTFFNVYLYWFKFSCRWQWLTPTWCIWFRCCVWIILSKSVLVTWINFCWY